MTVINRKEKGNWLQIWSLCLYHTPAQMPVFSVNTCQAVIRITFALRLNHIVNRYILTGGHSWGQFYFGYHIDICKSTSYWPWLRCIFHFVLNSLSCRKGVFNLDFALPTKHVNTYQSFDKFQICVKTKLFHTSDQQHIRYYHVVISYILLVTCVKYLTNTKFRKINSFSYETNHNVTGEPTHYLTPRCIFTKYHSTLTPTRIGDIWGQRRAGSCHIYNENLTIELNYLVLFFIVWMTTPWCSLLQNCCKKQRFGW